MMLGYGELRIIASVFLCGQGRTHTEHKLQPVGANLARKETSKYFAVEVEARERVRVGPAQAIRQVELPIDDFSKVDQLLHLCVRGHRVRRPTKRGDDLASLYADEFVPELRAVTIEVLRDDESADGSVDVELGFFIFHAYRIAPITEKARDFFAIVKVFFISFFA